LLPNTFALNCDNQGSLDYLYLVAGPNSWDYYPRISIQTAGLAFGGTGLCSYRVRGVDGSCAKQILYSHYVLTVILIIISIPSPTHCFIPGLKFPFSANPFHCSLSFLPRDAMHPRY